ncbi:hypothetical protein HUO13_24410 [Saccharopolyspora erythraea]|uniref:hypothetical protein n=1 Tax=Saccharopolyspora erythraea TaxID=1836 RepID=UPI001BA71C43|nr:hypothetical protein [Saccharopolyspora erythraea]QUH03541.1 hypothetical protein HUO13_24410 [Saccharopolyspora erythraea]
MTAEYLQAYLTSTGDAPELLAGLLVLGPLYGGAALLIRELGLRTGRGWPGVLLLAAAFGLAMPGLVDLALFGEQRADVAYWAELREPTLLEPLGISAYTTISWTAGHVVMSVGAPLALLSALAPAHRGRPLLGKAGIGVTALLFALAAVPVHLDGQRMYGYELSLPQAAGVLVVVALLCGAAFSRLGLPVAARAGGRAVPALWIVAGGVPAKGFDLLPPTWLGVAGCVALGVGAAGGTWWLAVNRRWSPREVGLLGGSAVVGGTLVGFLSPLPDGVAAVAKYGQSAVLLLLAVAVVVLVSRTSGAEAGVAPGRGGVPASAGER